MPHINRIRVNNIKYNFGTQAYEDFMLKPFGHNMLYDLANGGGKSVLLLMMMQTVLPNQSLDEKQPLEKLFRTADGSQTIHSLIEWKLDECDIVGGFRYMTTGFCARKAQNAEGEAKETASVDYFNYCIFYRDYNENDIRNLPLVKNKEKITYTGLKKYLKELERDNSLIVRIFDRKGEYQAFIADYGLYESEWEIIRGINRTEGHVRSYFESNYRTTRKVIEDLLIEEIIQKSFRAKGGQDDIVQNDMSKTLLDMKDKLMELSRKKNEISNFDHQMELLADFAEQVEAMKGTYQMATACKDKIVKLYQFAGHYARICRQRAEETEKELAGTRQSIHALHEKIDAARYVGDKLKAEELEQEMKRLKKETEAERAALDRAFRQMLLQESMNDYMEYQEEKARRDETQAELEAMKSEKSSLLAELQFLAFHLKKAMEQERQELTKEFKASETLYHSLKIRMRDTDEKERKASQELAIRKARIEAYQKSRKEISERLLQAKRKVGLLLLEESGKQRKAQEQELEAQKERELALQKQLKLLQKSIEILGKKQLECSFAQKQLAQEEDLTEDFFAQYEEQEARMSRLLAVYGARDYERLKEALRERDIQARTRLAQIKGTKDGFQRKLSMLLENAWDGLLEDVPGNTELCDDIQARYGWKAQPGKKYLAGCKKEQREALLQKYPYLPYALVVEDGVRELLQDARLQEIRQQEIRKKEIGQQESRSEGLLLLIKEAALRNGRSISNPEDMGLLSQDFGMFLQEGASEREKARLSAAISDIEEQERRLADQRATYQEDEKALHSFLFHYEEKYQENRRKCLEREKELALLKEQQQEYEEEGELLAQQKEETLELQERAAARIEELQQDITVLRKIEEDFAEIGELETELDKEQKERQRLEEERENLLCRMKEAEQESEEASARKNEIRIRLERMEAQWQEKYQAYDVPGEYGECDLPKDALEAELNGKRQAYEKEHSQEDDKKRLLQSYVSAMNRCLRAIGNRGISLSQLAEMDEAHKLYVTEEKEIARLRTENKKAEAELEKKNKALEQITGEWNRLNGKTIQLAAELDERYGKTPVLTLPEGDVQEYIEDNRSQINQLSGRAERLEKERKELEKESSSFEDIKKDIERMARVGKIGLPEETAMPEDGRMGLDGRMEMEGGAGLGGRVGMEGFEIEKAAQLKERFSFAEEEYDRLEEENKKRKEGFRKHFQKTVETLALFDAAPLAQEMKESIQMPENEEETMQLVKNLSEVKECLALEKSRVENGIGDIMNLKDNFESQCLQRCINIKTELDRLPKLSKITLGGEQIPMISLRVPYVREEFYRERMSNYIDGIVANVDGFEGQEERLKYIRNALSFKKLFSVIVTDMNAIRLELYKRERLREQSRHLRYEEAVGSTGQSQGIYIQFLIAIINYISNINSGKPDNAGIGKVIFLDNPFGAAKDIYIWEPIFELLRTNQVQLIVPARGTTPAITGRFDVNYILGQKLTDGKQQTVVVDYYSSVDTEEAEYVPLQYEQESFDFLE